VIKFLFFAIAIPITLAALCRESLLLLAWGNTTGWRGTLALLVSSSAALFLVLVSLGAVVYRLRRQFDKGAR
jgi:hypothetical protein